MYVNQRVKVHIREEFKKMYPQEQHVMDGVVIAETDGDTSKTWSVRTAIGIWFFEDPFIISRTGQATLTFPQHASGS